MSTSSKTNNWHDIERAAATKAHAAKIKDFEARLKKHQQVIEELESQLDVVQLLRDQKPRAGVYSIRPAKASANQAVAVAIASDWHVEETVDPLTVSGLNEFSLEIADRRIERFTQSVLRLVGIERGGTDIPVLVLGLLGDLMTGYIHEELREENSLSPTQTIIWLRERVDKMIRTLRKEGGFEKIVIPCSVGNHGRTTIKPRHSTSYKNSYEWLLYKVLQRDFAGDDIEWVIGESYHTYLSVYDKVFRLHHGDGLKYQGGIGGLTIPVEKAIAAWNKARVADLDIFGHWHQSQQNPKWISNGSLIGHNAYAVAIKAGYEPPQQTFFLFDAKRGRTGTWPVFLED
jgi:hypothetical protein